MIRSYETYKASTGEKLRALRERPNENTQEMCVVLCHGRSVDKDELGGFLVLSDNLLETGYDVFRFDFRGHGQSDGAGEDVTLDTIEEDISTTLSYLKTEKGYTRFIVIAASFSAGPALHFVNTSTKNIAGIVLWSAALDFSYIDQPIDDFQKQKWDKRKEELEKYGYAKQARRYVLSKVCYEQMITREPWRELGNVNIPIALIHGTADVQLPYEVLKKHADKFSIEMTPIEGASHGFLKAPYTQLAADACVKGIQGFTS